MRFLIPILVGTLGFAAMYLGARWGFRRAYPIAWQRPGVRRAVGALPWIWGGGLAVAFLARFAEAKATAHVGFLVAASVVLLLVSTLGPLVVAALVRVWADGRAAPAEAIAHALRQDAGGPAGGGAPSADAPGPRDAAPAGEPERPSARGGVEGGPERPSAEDGRGGDGSRRRGAATRRELLVRASAALPAGGVVLAGAGGVQGYSAAQLQKLEMAFPDLPPDLEGFRVLHYTDMHLGTYVDLLEVERLVELGRQARPDLVVLTGDMSDDLERLLPALRRFESLDPTYGVFASIGNHEYFRGIKPTLASYAKTNVEMLIEKGLKLRVGRADLYVGGADDPRILRGDKMAFMHRTVNEALDGAPSEAFRILLSHRPEGFVPAAQAGFHLTLSGHTHGAQLGFDGRSWLEGFMPDRYLWGAYAAGDRRLYTSSGAGHWFPFRLGCPRELPLIVLRRGPAGGEVVKTRIA